MIAPPMSPAATSVARTPNAPATGPTSAYDSGTSPIEMNQSRLETRPSSRPGMRRCFVVVHTISPALSNALKTKLAAISCHGSRANP